MSLYSITTRRPAAAIRRFLESHPQEVEIRIDRKRYTDRDLPELLATWCNNRSVRSTIDFEIRYRGKAIFGFHDDINQAWAANSEVATVESLIRDRIIRARLMGQQAKSGRSRRVLRTAFSWIPDVFRRERRQ